MADTAFRASRWRRAGATDKQLAELADVHAAMTVEEQAAEADRIDSISDIDLAAELEPGALDLSGGNVDDVIERVGGDPEKAAVALSHEQRRPRGPRSTLVGRLEEIIAVAAAQDG